MKHILKNCVLSKENNVKKLHSEVTQMVDRLGRGFEIVVINTFSCGIIWLVNHDIWVGLSFMFDCC